MSLEDTHRLVSGRDNASLEVAHTSAHEILDLILLMLKENPGRTDLWLMRFDILRTAGLKADFVDALREAFASSTLRREIDWVSVRRMWDGLTDGAPPPEGVVLPKSSLSPSPAKENPVKSVRRFSDIALQLAETELQQLAEEYQALRTKPNFFMDFAKGTREALKRPTPLHHAKALELELASSTRIFFKREDLHENTPETEMAAAQAHIAVSLGKQFIITGNDVDEFSLALARVAPRYGLKLTVVVRQEETGNTAGPVEQLRGLGAEVTVMRDSNLKSDDPREGALRLWAHMAKTSHLALSFGTGPNPYPRMVSDFQMLLGYETQLQLRAKTSVERPCTWVAAVHSEADSIGFMLPNLKRTGVELFLAEPSGADGKVVWKSSARLRAYNGAKREHTWLRALNRITHVPIRDAQARAMQEQVQRLEDISISLEDARAVALVAGLVKGNASDSDIVVLVG